MKSRRQGRIIDIIQRYEVGTQEELAERLRQEGFDVTQATVSRDIREMKLSKMPTADGGQKYVFLDKGARLGNKYVHVLREAFITAQAAQNILVVRTVSGMAMAVAAALDSLDFPEIVGCIARDDTIFVAAHTSEEAAALNEKLRLTVAQEKAIERAKRKA